MVRGRGAAGIPLDLSIYACNSSVASRMHFGSLGCCLGKCFLGTPHSLRVKEVVGSEWKDGRRLILLEDIVGAAKTPRCTGLMKIRDIS